MSSLGLIIMIASLGLAWIIEGIFPGHGFTHEMMRCVEIGAGIMLIGICVPR